MKKKISLIMALVLLIGIVGVTLAWLTDVTAPVENTFTVGDINIELWEDDTDEGEDGVWRREFKMIPGHTLEKDPLVSVKNGSEDAWLFIEILESNNFKNFLDYDVITPEWTQLKNESNIDIDGVYYRQVLETDTVREFSILKPINNEEDPPVLLGHVKVKNVTKEELNNLDDENFPTLTFVAYAHQYWKDVGVAFSPLEAWTSLKQ